MRIIAIETSGRSGSIAAVTGKDAEAETIRQVVLPGAQQTARMLAPELKSLLENVGWPPSTIELVAVASGPGSFTGLRIGVTTAKTLAYAVNAPIIGVDTILALAEQAPGSKAPLWAILDAQREELFCAKFPPERGPSPDVQTRIVPVEQWLKLLAPGDEVIGPVLSRLEARLPSGVVALPQDLWQPMASAVARVGWREFRQGRRDDLWQLTPNYLRASAAEEKKGKAGR